MRNKYFDTWKLDEAIKHYNTNLYETKTRLENYLKEYPYDNSAYIKYINTLINLGLFEEANKVFNYAYSQFINSSHYSDNEHKNSTQKSALAFVKLRLLCCQELYSEAYNFYLNNQQLFKQIDIEKVIFYCKMKLGLIDKQTIEDRNYQPYLYRQTIDYQESDFLYHAKEHCNDFISSNEERESEFAPNFPFEEVLLEIKKYIPSDKKLYPGFMDNMYFFRYDECGTYNKGVINYIKVITFNNSSNIITMYPYLRGDNFPCIDLNYMREKNIPKKKTRSQIDKFNSRYGIK